MTMESLWQPPDFNRPDSGRLGEIRAIFQDLYPSSTYGDLAADISRYWISRLKDIWTEKPDDIKAKDLTYHPSDPLSRIRQKTVLITYADSVWEKGAPALLTLEQFLKSHFPAIGGLHILPACEISENRFNDGGFSQIRRNRIHAPYGTNARFEAMMAEFFSMTDFVLNHVDMAHPRFQQYLDGDDTAGDCFFVFSESEFRKRHSRGDFDRIFRPRPFPLFTIFRRKPKGAFAGQPRAQRTAALNRRFQDNGLPPLPDAVIHILPVFNKIKNDQMLLAEDYQPIPRFRNFLENVARLNPDDLFVVSKTQETRHTPYIFNADTRSPEDLLALVLPGIGIPVENAAAYAAIFADSDTELFGEPIRALTTFSHVQVDLNTTTFEGLKLLIDDFSWYLKMDLNMLRLDAANFAFKKWGTSCFGLPEVRKLLKILYRSMDCVAPRIVPNLEVNAPLSAVLNQMADKQAPPPMMYDFHLAGMLPVVFNTADARPLLEIFNLIDRYDISHDQIRFSLAESHDGKSVSGSGGADRLLSYAQLRDLVDVVKKNGGYVKTKSTPKYRYPAAEFEKVCDEAGFDPKSASKAIFDGMPDEAGILHLKKSIRDPAGIARALNVDPARLKTDAALNFFVNKIFTGREPYELCITTRDILEKMDNPVLEARRYLAFKTLAFALMGRHVKAVYFNDLMGLKNDRDRVEKTGELRDIKRTRSERSALERLISDPATVECRIARQMNNLIALVDADPAFHPRGAEARLTVEPAHPAVALVHTSWQDHHTLVIVNTGGKPVRIAVGLPAYGLSGCKVLWENLTGTTLPNSPAADRITLALEPFSRFWIKPVRVKIDKKLSIIDT